MANNANGTAVNSWLLKGIKSAHKPSLSKETARNFGAKLQIISPKEEEEPPIFSPVPMTTLISPKESVCVEMISSYSWFPAASLNKNFRQTSLSAKAAVELSVRGGFCEYKMTA